MLALNSILFGCSRKHLDDYWDLVIEIYYRAVKVIKLKATGVVRKNLVSVVKLSHSWKVAGVQARGPRFFAQPMQLIGKDAVKKAASLFQLLTLEEFDKIGEDGLRHPTLLNNDAKLTFQGLGLNHIGPQAPKHCPDPVQTVDLGIDRSFDCKTIAAHGKLDELCVSLPLPSVCSLHYRDGPRCGSNGGETGNQRLIVRDELAPGVRHSSRYGRKKKSGSNYQHAGKQHSSLICSRHPDPPATATPSRAALKHGTAHSTVKPGDCSDENLARRHPRRQETSRPRRRYYRAELGRITGKQSIKDMTEAELEKVLTVFRNEGFAPAPAVRRVDGFTA